MSSGKKAIKKSERAGSRVRRALAVRKLRRDSKNLKRDIPPSV